MVTTSSHGSRLTRSTAAQMPTVINVAQPRSNIAAALVVGDDLVELLLLVATVVEVVGVHRFAERIATKSLPSQSSSASRRAEGKGSASPAS